MGGGGGHKIMCAHAHKMRSAKPDVPYGRAFYVDQIFFFFFFFWGGGGAYCVPLWISFCDVYFKKWFGIGGISRGA